MNCNYCYEMKSDYEGFHFRDNCYGDLKDEDDLMCNVLILPPDIPIERLYGLVVFYKCSY